MAFNWIGPTISTPTDLLGRADDWLNSEEIFVAVVSGDINQLEKCLMESSNINIRNDEGMTPLHFAADRGNNAMVTLLLQHGADINAQDEDGQTPLMIAAICDHHDVVRTLIDKGAVTSITNREGHSVFELSNLSDDIRQFFISISDHHSHKL